MYKIDRRGGGGPKSFTRTDPNFFYMGRPKLHKNVSPSKKIPIFCPILKVEDIFKI